MRRITLFLACLFVTGLLSAQSLKKYTLAGSGCSYYNYCEITFELSKSEDSSSIWTGECLKDDINYGIICVKLREAVTDLSVAEDLMISYADYLKTSFKITKVAGYGKGHRLQNKENTRGIIDYWGDLEKNNWKIKAWTDGKFIGFLFVYSLKELPEQKINLFLDGFRLQSDFELINNNSSSNSSQNNTTANNNTNNTDVFYMKKGESGTYKISCYLNGIPMEFTFDTGASDVSISLTEAKFLLKNGNLKIEDIKNKQNYTIANGNVEVGYQINIRELKIGSYTLTNVRGSISSSDSAPLLLGMSAIEKLGLKFDPNKGALVK